MNNILTKWKVNLFTYFYLFLAFVCGYFFNVCLLFLIVIIHELGHVISIKFFHYKIKEIDLYPFGGITKIDEPLNSSINKNIVIALSGITFQLILGLFVNVFFKHQIISLKTYNLFTFYNQTILIFNLLPIYPLDGSKLLNLILEKYLPYTKAMTLTNGISFLFVLLFIIYNILTPVKNYLICSFLVIQFIIIVKNQKYLKIRFLLERYLYQFPYQKIESHKNDDLNLLKKNTLHFFQEKDYFLHEKKLLAKIFDKKI